VRFAGQSFTAVALHAIGFFMDKKLYTWRRSAKTQLLTISGPEYEEYAEETDIPESSLSLISQKLNTEGTVLNEDEEDPLMIDEQAA
jgi:hypothetical protein